jgi:hypothetical protein
MARSGRHAAFSRRSLARLAHRQGKVVCARCASLGELCSIVAIDHLGGPMASENDEAGAMKE